MQDFKKYWWIIAVALILIFAIGAKMWGDQRAKERRSKAVNQEVSLVLLELSAQNMAASKDLGYTIMPQEIKKTDSIIMDLEKMELKARDRRRLEAAVSIIEKAKKSKK